MEKEFIWITSENDRNFMEGDVVQHFKHDDNSEEKMNYRYQIVGFAKHTETKEELVIYRALYVTCEMYAKPKEMFISEMNYSCLR